MPNTPPSFYTTFQGHRRIASGSLQTNALAARRAQDAALPGAVLIFDDTTGRTVDLDLRGSDDDIAARYAAPSMSTEAVDQPDVLDVAGPKGRGRPKLGVVPREVTLLPRHWEWLASQPGGASVALRKLVEEARRVGADHAGRRAAHERAYHFMQAIGGDLPGFEEGTRALFADDRAGVATILAAWPRDVADHAMQLAFGEPQAVAPEAL